MYRKSKYKHLFFDLDNTLIDFDGAALLVLEELFIEKKIDQYFHDFASFYSIYSKINKELWHQYKDHTITKDAVKYGRFEQTLAIKEVDNPTLSKTLGDAFVERVAHKHILIPGCIEVLDALKSSYNMHIISNGFTEVQNHKLTGTGLNKYFDWVILSEAVKSQKPNRPIFETAVKNANAKKSESLMIGDNYDTDITGARNFGMDQAWYVYHNGFDLSFKPTYTIHTLIELLQIL